MSGDRLQRLRDLVARLEQLPDSEERDRVLSEVRARAVDLDTGETPRAMLPVDPEVPYPVLAKPSFTRPRTNFVAPYKPRTARAAWTQPLPVASPPAINPADPLGIDAQLSLEDSPAPAARAPGERIVRPWEQGLRG